MGTDLTNRRDESIPRLGPSRLTWLPVPLLLATMLCLWAIGSRVTYESPLLVLVFNFILNTLASAFIAYLAGRSFLVRGSPGVLLLGCGAVAWGAAGVVANSISQGEPNLDVTIHNCGVWVSALLHLAGAVWLRRPRYTVRAAAAWLGAGYLGALGAVGLGALWALHGHPPGFFVPGTGGTLVRWLVLGSALCMFLLAAVLISIANPGRKSVFLRWYVLALEAIAVGLLGILLQATIGGLVPWVGRAAMWLSGVYMVLAALASVRESGVWEISLAAALHQSEERLALAASGTRIGMYEWEIATGQTRWTEQVARLLGLRPTTTTTTSSSSSSFSPEYHYHDWAERVHPEDLPRVEAELRRCLAERASYEAEYRIVWPEGSVHWMADRGVFQYESDGRCTHLLGILTDITDRKQAEITLADAKRALERERDVLQAVMDGAKNSHLVYLDRDFNFVRVNETYAQTCGYRPEEMIGKNHFALYPHAENEVIFARVRDTGAPFEIHDKPFEYPDQPERGVTYWDWTVTPVKGAAGRVEGLIFSLHETTERKRAEAALRELNATLEDKVAQRTAELAYRAKQLQKLTLELTQAEEQERRRIAVILHEDLQQQMAGAKFHLDRVKGQVKDDRLRADIDEVGGILKGAIEQSRRLSRDLSPAVVNMNDLGEVLQWQAHRIRAQQGLSVNLAVVGDMRLHSEPLAMFLFRAAQEMLFNVVKHAQVREAAIRLRRIGRYVCLSVSDRGRGFDPRELKETSGVGVFSIRERTELLGGRMKVKSVKGEGSRFSIVVPDGQKTEDSVGVGPRAYPISSASPSHNGEEGNHGRLPLRVLLVDDHEVVREGLAALLREAPGIALIGEAPDGREAINLAADLRPDVVIMDVSMPLMKGDEATRQIKTYLPQTRVIALSMYDEADKKQSMFEAGAESYILKTISAEDLIAAIRGEREGTRGNNGIPQTTGEDQSGHVERGMCGGNVSAMGRERGQEAGPAIDLCQGNSGRTHGERRRGG